MKKISLAFCLFLLAASGCSQVTVLRTQELRKVETNLAQRIDSLSSDTREMQAMMGTGFKEQLANVREQEAALNRMKADIQALISNLERQLALLEGRLDESQHRLATIAQITDRIDSKEFVIKGGGAGGSDSTQKGQGSPKVVVKEKTDVDKLYKLAYEDFQSGKVDLAREGFEEILKNYPAHELAGNSQYWIGECEYIKKDFKKAVDEYQKVVANFPQGNKAPAALYKMGIAYEKLNNLEERNKTWKMLVLAYPQSNEAKLAKERME